MLSLVYSEEEFKVMLPVYNKLMEAKNITEAKRYRKTLASFINIMQNIHNHPNLQVKDCDILHISKGIKLDAYPFTSYYKIIIQKVDK